MSRDLLGPKGAGILLFIEELDLAHPNTVVIEVELLGGIDGVADLDPLTDIGGGDLVESPFEADGGIVIDDPFVADEEDFIELLSGEPSDQDPAHGAVITIDGPLLNPGVEFMVIIFLKPETKGFVQFLQGETLLESREESFADCSEEPFHLPAGRAVIRLGVDERDPGLGTASSQEVRGETRPVIDVQTLTNAVGEESLLEDKS
jgi:hypothetical protein